MYAGCIVNLTACLVHSIIAHYGHLNVKCTEFTPTELYYTVSKSEYEQNFRIVSIPCETGVKVR